MSFPEPEFISICEAANNVLKCSIERIHFYINSGFISAYAKIPTFLPKRSYDIESEDDIFVPPSPAIFWKEQLSEYCKLIPPVKWGNFVECNTISVMTATGTFPTPSELKLSKNDGRIEQSGNFFWCSGWSFSEEKVLLKTTEIRSFIDKYEADISLSESVKLHIEKRQDEGECDEVIAVELCDKNGEFRLENRDIAELFNLHLGLNDTQHKTIKQRGHRFKTKGIKILKDRLQENK